MARVVNSQLITLARELRGLTQDELALRLGVKQAYVCKIEGSLLEVSNEYLLKLSKELELPEEFFFQEDEVKAVGSGCNYHRKRERLTRRDWYRITARLNLLRMHVSRLLRGVQVAATTNFPNLDPDEYGTPEKIAKTVRYIWKLPSGPVHNVTRAIENAGGVVFRMPFETDNIDAISQSIPGQPPLFLVNAAIPGDRLRFTLSHEIGHIVMHSHIPGDDMEKQADRFAAEFLMPEEDIRASLSPFTLQRAAASLKPYWKVAISALMRRAKDLKVITPQAYVNHCKRMSSLGYNKHEPVMIPPEEPTVLSDTFKLYFEEMKYTSEELSKVIHFNPDEMEREYLCASIRVLRAI